MYCRQLLLHTSGAPRDRCQHVLPPPPWHSVFCVFLTPLVIAASLGLVHRCRETALPRRVSGPLQQQQGFRVRVGLGLHAEEVPER